MGSRIAQWIMLLCSLSACTARRSIETPTQFTASFGSVESRTQVLLAFYYQEEGDFPSALQCIQNAHRLTRNSQNTLLLWSELICELPQKEQEQQWTILQNSLGYTYHYSCSSH